jgi:hypothetical protein
MPQRIAILTAWILLISFCLPGCAYMTTQGRREMAYRRYVNKSIKQRQRQIARAQKAANRKLKHDWQARAQVPSEPIVHSSLEPVSAGDQFSTPVTVSAPNTIEPTEAEPSP